MNGFRFALNHGTFCLVLAGIACGDPGPAIPDDAAGFDRLRSHLKDNDRQVRADAVVALGKLGDKAAPAARLMIAQFADAKEQVTVAPWTSPLSGHAERALLLIGPGAVPALTAGLLDGNVDVRSRCALVLGQIGGVPDDTVIVRLIELLGDADYRVAGNASSALKRFGVHSAEPLLAVLKEGLKIPAPTQPWEDGEQPDPDDPLTPARKKRNYAIGVLATLDEPRAIEPLLDALDTKDLLLHRWAENSLPLLKSEACQAVFSRDDIVMRLLGLLQTDDRRSRYAISRTLGLVSKDARGSLITALEDPDRRVRVALFDMWSQIRNDDRVLPAALKRAAAEDDDGALMEPLAIMERRQAIQVLRNYLRTFSSPETVLSVLLTRLDDPASSVRNTAAHALADMPDAWSNNPRIMPALLRALETRTDTSTRMGVIYAIGEIGDGQATLPLAGLLNQEPLFETSDGKQRSEFTREEIDKQDDRIREWICTALIQLDDPRAIPALRVRRSMNEPHVIEALGKLGDQDAVPELLERLLSESFELRLAAAKALQGTPDRRSIKPLTAALNRELRENSSGQSFSDWQNMQSELALALAATGEPEAATILVQSLRVAPHQPFSFDDDYAGRIELSRRAADDPRGRALYQMGYKLGLIPVAPLIAELRAPHRPPRAFGDSDEEPEPAGSTVWSREVSAWALKSILSEEFDYGNIRHPQAEAALLACLKIDNERGLQLHAANALGQMHSEPAVPDLARIMSAAGAESADVTDKDMAGEAGNRFGILFSPPSVPDAQLDAIELATTAATALSWIDAPAAADSIPLLLSHGVADVRRAAIFALVSAKHEQTFELIVPLLDDPAATVRQTVARQLGFVGDKRAVPLLITLLETESKRPAPAPRRHGGYRLSGPNSDPRQETLSMAAQSMGMLNDMTAGDALLGLTQSDATEVRTRATLALVQIGDERGTEALRTIMTGDDAKLRERLASRARTLTRFATNGYCPHLTLPSARAVLRASAETDASTSVRSSAIAALGGVSDDDTIEWLLTKTRSEHESLRAAALRALLKTTNAGRFDVLRQFLKDGSPICQSVAIAEFALLHSSAAPQDGRPSAAESLAAIVPLLDDSAEQVRVTTLRSISKLLTRTPKVDNAIIERLQRAANSDPSLKVRQRARGVMTLLP